MDDEYAQRSSTEATDPPGFHWLCLECGVSGPHLEVFAAAVADGEAHADAHDADLDLEQPGCAVFTIQAGPPPDRPPFDEVERAAIAMALLRGMRIRDKQQEAADG